MFAVAKPFQPLSMHSFESAYERAGNNRDAMSKLPALGIDFFAAYARDGTAQFMQP